MSIKLFKNKIHFIIIVWLVLTLFSLFRESIVYRNFEFTASFSLPLAIDSLISGGYTLLILSFPLFFFRWSIRKYFLVVGIAPVLSNLFNYIHLFQYKTPITMGAFAVIFETTPGEATEFFNLIAPSHIVLSIILAIIPWLLFFFIPSKTTLFCKTVLKGVGIIFGCSFLISSIHETIRERQWHYTHHSFEHAFLYNDAKRIAYYFRERKKLKNIRSQREGIEVMAGQPATLDSIPQVYVLVLGESVAKGHKSLYGYYRQTTPFLDSLSNLYRFDDVISPATQTRTAIMLLLTPATVTEPDRYYFEPSILQLVKTAGFKTWWISNQMMFGISDTETTVIARDADYTTFVNTDWNTNSLDERMLQPFKEALQHAAPRKMIVLHMLGSHHAYHRRYPHRDPFLLPDTLINPGHWDQRQKQLVQEYDNSVRYTDYVLSLLINELEKLPNAASMIFLSDHGQEVFDRPGVSMGHGSPRLVREVIDVPFWVWMNEQHKKDKSLMNHIPPKYLNRPFSMEHLFHAVARFMQIESPIIKPEKSLFDDDFIPSQRDILNATGKIIPYEEVLEQ